MMASVFDDGSCGNVVKSILQRWLSAENVKHMLCTRYALSAFRGKVQISEDLPKDLLKKPHIA